LRWRIAQAAELRWWKHYLRGRTPAEYLEQKRNYWINVLSAAGISPQPQQHILDAGCGPAGIFMALEQCRVDAVDPLLKQYEATLPHFQPADYPHVYFNNQTLETFVPENPYSLVFCMNAINHVANWRLALDRLVSAVAPGGILVLAVDVHRRPWLRYLFRLLPFDILHPHQHHTGDYQKELNQRGLSIKQMITLRPGFIFNYVLVVARRN
jgi:2-polyprenyl-6-hydroxyphenyl methylase/3-demethylubiquinone-9 3-methyltransferase